MKSITSTEICTVCSGCCKASPFIELSNDEISALKEETGLRKSEFTHPIGRDSDEVFLQHKQNASCIFLTEEVGRSFCSVYKARPTICRTYPSTPKQYKTCSEISGYPLVEEE